MPKHRYTDSRVLRQAMSVGDSDARDKKIKDTAMRKARAHRRRFSRYVKGLKCPFCDSRKTITEFYRLKPDEAPRFGALACDNCGAC